MKICIPTLGTNGLQEKLSPHFGSAPTFTLVNLDNMQVEVLVNNNEHHEHGQCHPLAALSGRDVEAVVCGGMGRGAVAGLKAGGVKAFLSTEGTVGEIIAAYKAGTVKEITMEGACSGHGCH